MKYVVSLGGGENQLPFIQELNKRGIQIIVIDQDISAKGKLFSNIYLNLSIEDKEKILNELNNLDIIGIISEQTDKALLTIGYLNKKMNLLGLIDEQAQIVRDKLKQREFLKEIKEIHQPNFINKSKIKDESILKKNKSNLYLIKPRVGQSSIGVEFFNLSFKNEKNKNFIVEEYIAGIDISLDGFVSNDLYFTCYCEKEKYKGTFVDRVLYAKSQIPTELKMIATNIINKLKVNNVFFHMEFILKNEKYYVVEFTCRGGGSGLSTLIASHVSMIDTVKTRINILLGEKFIIPNENNSNFAAMVFGRSKEIKILSNIMYNNIPLVKIIVKQLNQNSTIYPKDGTDREGCAYILTDNKFEAKVKQLIGENNFD